MKTEKLRTRLRKKVLGPEGQGSREVFLEEVTVSPIGTGRRLDAVSMGMWASRGHLLTGYELKTSRSDWLGELKDPSKAEELARFCDRFFLVIGDAKVADIGEVPPKWGLMVARGNGLSTVRDATPLEPEDRPDYFLASLLRRAVKGDLSREIRVANEAAKEEADRRYKTDLKMAEQKATHANEKNEEFVKAWKTFQDATGEEFPNWIQADPIELARVGRVVAALRRVDDDSSAFGRVDPIQQIENALARVQDLAGTLTHARDELSTAIEEANAKEEVDPTTNP